MDVFFYPFLENLGLYTPPDPTYGRYLFDAYGREKDLEADTEIQVKQRRVFVDKGHFLRGEDVTLTQEELERGKGKEWVYYKVWQKGPGNGSDVIFIHGKCQVSSTNYAECIFRYLCLRRYVFVPRL